MFTHLVRGNWIFCLTPEIKNQAGSQFTHRDINKVLSDFYKVLNSSQLFYGDKKKHVIFFKNSIIFFSRLFQIDLIKQVKATIPPRATFKCEFWLKADLDSFDYHDAFTELYSFFNPLNKSFRGVYLHRFLNYKCIWLKYNIKFLQSGKLCFLGSLLFWNRAITILMQDLYHTRILISKNVSCHLCSLPETRNNQH